MLEHLGALAHAVVVEHLRGNRDGRDGCLELVRHVVDEVVLDLAQLLLPEGHGDGIQEHTQQQEGECQRGHQELHRREDVVALGGEHDVQRVLLALRVIGEKHQAVNVLLRHWGVAAGLIDDTVGAVHDRKLKG